MRYSYCPTIMNHSKNKQSNSPSVFLDVENAVLLVSEPLCRVVPAQLLDELAGAPGDVAGEVDGVDALQDDVVGLHGVGAGEGRGAWKRVIREMEV